MITKIDEPTCRAHALNPGLQQVCVHFVCWEGERSDVIGVFVETEDVGEIANFHIRAAD